MIHVMRTFIALCMVALGFLEAKALELPYLGWLMIGCAICYLIAERLNTWLTR